jgi:serine/threonine-protein kinase
MRQMRRGRRTPSAIAAVTAIAAAAGILTGCGGSDGAPASATVARTTYVGKLAGSGALVGIVTSGDTVRAYVCDGRRLGLWFDAARAGDAVDASAHGSRLTASFAGRSATGSVTIDGARSQRFEAVRATGDAGLYRGAAKGYVAGWVRLADGTQRGVLTSKTGVSPAPTLSSKAIIDGRIGITPIPIPSATPVPIPTKVAPAGGIGS